MSENMKFSTVINDHKFHTEIDVESNTIKIATSSDIMFEGTLDEFKEKVKEEEEFERHYKSILGMAELLIDSLSKR